MVDVCSESSRLTRKGPRLRGPEVLASTALHCGRLRRTATLEAFPPPPPSAAPAYQRYWQCGLTRADTLYVHYRAAIEMDYAKKLGTLSKIPFGNGETGSVLPCPLSTHTSAHALTALR